MTNITAENGQTKLDAINCLQTELERDRRLDGRKDGWTAGRINAGQRVTRNSGPTFETSIQGPVFRKMVNFNQVLTLC